MGLFNEIIKDLSGKMKSAKIRTKPGIKGMKFFFTCDVCGTEYGPESSLLLQIDGGKKLMSNYYLQCPDCHKFSCKNTCWNYKKGTCTTCNKLILPEYIVEKKKMRNEYYYVCSVCRNKLGPVSETDYGKLMNIAKGAAKIAVGAALIAGTGGVAATSGAKIVAGGVGDAFSKSSSEKTGREAEASAKGELIQCPTCERWVCEDCWDKTVGKCNGCTH